MIPVYEVLTLKEAAVWFGRRPSTIMAKLMRESLREPDEVMRKSCGTWLIDARFALKYYTPVTERPSSND